LKSEQQFNKEFVCKTFRRLFISKWKGKGKTLHEFAEAISLEMDGAKCTFRNVSRWLNGDTEPVKYLPAICKVLEVEESEFIPKTHDERYQYSSEFADGLERQLELIATKDFKIDLTFLQGVRNIIPDFDTRFPIITPLVFRENDSKEPYFKRAIPEYASETSDGTGLFQISRDDKKYFLSVYDLKVIKMIQKKTAIYIKSFLDQISADLKKREADATTKYIEQNDDIWIHVPLSDEQLQEIDPYGYYTEAERKKYHLPEGKIFTEEEKNHGNG